MMWSGTSLLDPADSGALANAASWFRALATGTLATIAATLAVAALGFLMLQGRLPLRRGAAAIIGCFLIFGAAVIAEALLGTATRLTGGVAGAKDTLPPTAVNAPPQPQVYDPYAGAAVPNS